MLALDQNTIIKTDAEPLPIICLHCGYIYTPPITRARMYSRPEHGNCPRSEQSVCGRCHRVNVHSDCASWREVGTSDVAE